MTLALAFGAEFASWHLGLEPGYFMIPESWNCLSGHGGEVQALTEIVRLTREHGAKPFMVNFWGSTRGKATYRQALNEVAAELQVPTLHYDGPRLDLIHPTREGNQQLARELLVRLEAEGYVVGSPPSAGDSGQRDGRTRWSLMPITDSGPSTTVRPDRGSR